MTSPGSAEADRDPFRGAKLKVNRAVRHINEFHAVAAGYLKSDFYCVTNEANQESGLYGIRIDITVEPPPELFLCMGDAIHNLRTSLDYIATKIVRDFNGSTEFVTFPFDKLRQNLIDRVRKAPIEVALPGISDLIIDRIRPYEQGDGLLWALTKLDKIDKHNMLVPTVTPTFVRMEDLVGDDGSTIIRMDCPYSPTNRYFLSSVQKFEVKGKITPHFDVLFKSGEVVSGKSVLSALLHMGKSVKSAIEIIEELWLSYHPSSS